MAPLFRPNNRDGFEIAIVCALRKERDAVEALLDEDYETDGFSYGKAAQDPNAYTTGRLGNQHVVLAYMPNMGKVNAAAVASNIPHSFQKIKIGLVVGICGGVPTTPEGTEILLGDVIISTSVIQIDFGRQYPNGFVRKKELEDTLGRANPEIRAFTERASGYLVHARLKEKTNIFSTQICMRNRYHKSAYPGPENDKLYPPSYRHKHQKPDFCTTCGCCRDHADEVCEAALKSDCEDLDCDDSLLVSRERVQKAKGLGPGGSPILSEAETREAQKALIHFGRIACSDSVMKSGQFRDKIAADEKVIGFEMESAGTWDYIPTVVIKGVSDYSDSHKSKGWQEHAAATAAACAKAFLEEWRTADRSESDKLISQIWTSSLQRALREAEDNMQRNWIRFETEIELLDRQTQRRRHLEILKLISGSEETDPAASRIQHPIRTVPLPRNPTFVGCKELLRQVHAHLEQTESPGTPTGLACFVLNGIGGSGKTQVALEYTYLYHTSYDAIFWINAETEIELASTFSQIGKKLIVSSTAPNGNENCATNTKNLDNSIQLIEKSHRWLEETNRRWLLVFDNVNSWKTISAYWPVNLKHRGSVVITTQIPNMSQMTEKFLNIEVESLPIDDGVELLLKLTNQYQPTDDERAIAKELCLKFGGHPLSIATASGYISQTQSSLEEAAAIINRSFLWSKTNGSAVWQYERTLDTVFDTALAELSDSARRMLDIMAFLNPNAVPEDLFLVDEGDGKRCFKSLEDMHFRNIVLNLRQRQLIKRFSDATGSYISIHRSLQYSLLQMLSANPTDRQNVFLQACNMIRKVLPVLTELSPVHERQETYRSYEKFLPQVISLSGNISQLEPPLIPPLEFINLLCDAGTFMWDIGLVNQGIKIYQEAETMLDKIGVNPSDPIYARVSNVLGILYQRVGITMYKEVLKRKKRTLEIYENQLPLSTVCHTDEDLNRLQSGHNGVGIGLLFCGQFKEAEERFEKTKQIYERLGTEENTPYNFARYNINMALARCYQGKHEDAVRYADNAQRLVEEASTGQHGRAVYIKFLRGKVLSAAGRYREALPAQESVTILSASVSGESAYQTICCISEIGALNYRCGNLEMAEMLLRKALKGWATIDMSDLHRARMEFYLSATLRGLAQSQEAELLEAKAVKIRDKILHDFPDLISVKEGDEGSVYDQIVFIPIPPILSESRE